MGECLRLAGIGVAGMAASVRGCGTASSFDGPGRCCRPRARLATQAVVADAVEAGRQHMDEEAADDSLMASVITLYRSGPSTR